jgi:histidine triad (HIT) family protein
MVRRPGRIPTQRVGSEMKRKWAVIAFVLGLIAGELNPLGWLAWRVIALRLPSLKARSLAAPSVFESVPSSRWIGESPNAFVLNNDVAPIAPVHLLVIPKRRYTSILEAPPELLGEMLELAKSAATERGIAEKGFRVVINTNPEGGQTVYHLHMHVLGGTQLDWPLLPEIRSRLVDRSGN